MLLLGSTLTVMAGGVLSPVVGLLQTDLDLTAVTAGLVITAHGLSLALAGPAVGRAIDRWGVRGPLTTGLLLYGVAGGAGLLTTSYPALIASRLVFGVGAAVVFTGTTLALLDLYEGAARDRVMGWRSTAISLGGVIWPLAGGALGAISWHAPFAVYLLGVPLGLAALRALPAPARPATTGAHTNDPAQPLRALISSRPRLLGIYGLQIVATVLLYGILVFLPLRLAEVGITDTRIVAAFTATLSVTMSLAGLRYAQARARLGHTQLLILAYSIWTISLATLALTHTPTLLLAAPALFGIGMGLAVPTLTVLTAQHAPANRRGQATALLATATFTGQFTSPLLLGPIQTATSVTGTFLTTAALAAGTLIALLATGPGRPPGNRR
ncbi:MFS transporter [Dactylosporangium sp. NPDC050688]|uniref:MFS transporter n=1 Tax=Dactylosporangium sp. NPDC050688 TaxID=3157217 RepID=UPI003407D929